MSEPKEGELDCRINIKKVAQYLAEITFFTNRLRREFDRAGLTAQLNEYEEKFKKEHGLDEKSRIA